MSRLSDSVADLYEIAKAMRKNLGIETALNIRKEGQPGAYPELQITYKYMDIAQHNLQTVYKSVEGAAKPGTYVVLVAAKKLWGETIYVFSIVPRYSFLTLRELSVIADFNNRQESLQESKSVPGTKQSHFNKTGK